MEFRKAELLRKYAELRGSYIDSYEPDLSREGYTVRYAKIPDPCLSSDLCSHRILRHFDAKKALFPRLYNKLLKGAEPAAYAEMYFDKDGKLHHLVHQISETVYYVTIPVSKQLQADYRVEHIAGRKPFITFLCMEWTEYDPDGNPVSVESFQRNGSLADGVIISCEYYRYENGKLIHADYYKEFDSDGRIEEPLVRRMVPDRIMNPEVFAYDFQRTEGGILCTRTIYWSASKTYTGSFLMPEKELKKMEEHGMSFA